MTERETNQAFLLRIAEDVLRHVPHASEDAERLKEMAEASAELGDQQHHDREGWKRALPKYRGILIHRELRLAKQVADAFVSEGTWEPVSAARGEYYCPETETMWQITANKDQIRGARVNDYLNYSWDKEVEEMLALRKDMTNGRRY